MAQDLKVKYWKIGYAERDITPKGSRVLACGFAQERFLQGTLEPLKIQSLSLNPGKKQRAVFITIDICSMDRPFIDVIKQTIATRFNIHPSAVIIAATHTHWGPTVSHRMIPLVGSPNPWYIDTLEEKILSAVAESISLAKSATLHFMECQHQIGAKRRTLARRGEVTFSPHRQGFYDRHTPILLAQLIEQKRSIALVSHACHPTASGPIKKWSADYPGAFRDGLEKHLGVGAKVMFAMGCGADAKVTSPKQGINNPTLAAYPKNAKARGLDPANEVYKTIDQHFQSSTSQQKTLSPSITHKCAKGFLRQGPSASKSKLSAWARCANHLQNPDLISQITKSWARQMLLWENDRPPFQYQVQIWKLGGRLTMCALEGEVCSSYGPKVRALIKSGASMIIAYAGAIESYIPDRPAVINSDYEGFLSSRVYGQPAPFTLRIENEFMTILKKALQ